MFEQEVSLAQLADALGVTVQRVEELVAEGVIEETRPGHAGLGESVRRYNEDAETEAWVEQEVTIMELADTLGLTVQRVEELAAEGVIEETRPGHVRLGESIRRHNEHAIEYAIAAALAEREVTIAELADVLNLTVQRVNQLAAEGIIEKTRHGHARFGSSVRRYIDYYVRYHVERATAKGNPEQISSGERVLAERARKLKRENDEKEASLMKMTDVLTTIDVMVETIQSGIASIPARVTDDPVLRRRIKEALDPVAGGLTERHRDATAALKQGRDPYSVINQEARQPSPRTKGNRRAFALGRSRRNGPETP